MSRLNSGALLIIAGVAIVVASITTLFAMVPGLGPPYPPTPNYQLITTAMQLAWFFIFFGSLTIFMGIRRVSPVVDPRSK